MHRKSSKIVEGGRGGGGVEHCRQAGVDYNSAAAFNVLGDMYPNKIDIVLLSILLGN